MHPLGGSRPQRRGAVMSRARDPARRDGQEARGSERQGRVRRGMGQLCRHHTSGTPSSPSLGDPAPTASIYPRARCPPAPPLHLEPSPHPTCLLRSVLFHIPPPGGSRGRVGTALNATARLHQRGSSQPKGPGPSLPPRKQATRSHNTYCIRGILSVPEQAPREVTARNAYGRP